jgi:adenylate kinase family enzyme
MSQYTFIIFGASGSGKGTQAHLLIDFLKKLDSDMPVLYIETGQRFREFADSGSYTATLVKGIMSTGALLPEFLPIWIWTEILVEEVKGRESIIFEGVSRREHEAPILDSAMRFYKRENPFVISLEVSKEWATERLMARGRYDDTVVDIKERLGWYDENVLPAIADFKKNPYYKFISVNGEQGVEDVHKEILKKLGI